VRQRLLAMAEAKATAERFQAAGAPIARGAETKNLTPKPVQAQHEDSPREAESDEKWLWPDAADRRYEGKVKAFDVQQGYGFIQSPDIHSLYGCDAFLNQSVAGGCIVGSMVSFSIEIVKGKPQARNVMLEDDPAMHKPVKDFDAPGTAVPGPQAAVNRGRVKSFNAAKGFGFISSRELQYNFGGRDVYVSKTQAPDGNLTVGQEVEFQLVLDRQGQPQAREVTYVAPKRGPGMQGGLSTGVGPGGMPLFSQSY
jgi:cold shock CspA family protein